jgi:hypothetical protein
MLTPWRRERNGDGSFADYYTRGSIPQSAWGFSPAPDPVPMRRFRREGAARTGRKGQLTESGMPTPSLGQPERERNDRRAARTAPHPGNTDTELQRDISRLNQLADCGNLGRKVCQNTAGSAPLLAWSLENMVGASGFEPPASWSRSLRPSLCP